MTVVLALDPGQRTGWALAKPGMPAPRKGYVDMPDVKNIGTWANSFKEWLIPFARLEGVTHIVQEAPIIVSRKKKGGGVARPDINVVVKHVGIMIVAAMCADELGLPLPDRPNRNSVTSHFVKLVPGQKVGDMKANSQLIKSYVLAQCQAKGWAIKDLNTADALATLDWYCHENQIAVGWDCSPAAGPLFAAKPAEPPKPADELFTDVLRHLAP